MSGRDDDGLTRTATLVSGITMIGVSVVIAILFVFIAAFGDPELAFAALALCGLLLVTGGYLLFRGWRRSRLP